MSAPPRRPSVQPSRWPRATDADAAAGSPPAATVVAEWSSADTGDGPAIAREIQKEKGSCADLPSAETTSPAVSRSLHPALAPGRAAKASEPAPARAAPGSDVLAEVGGAGDEGGGPGRPHPVDVAPPEADQGVRHRAHELPREPQHQQVRRRDRQEHGACEHQHQAEEPRPRLSLPQVGGAEHQHQQRDGCDRDHQHRRQGVHGQRDVRDGEEGARTVGRPRPPRGRAPRPKSLPPRTRRAGPAPARRPRPPPAAQRRAIGSSGSAHRTAVIHAGPRPSRSGRRHGRGSSPCTAFTRGRATCTRGR